MKKRLVGMRNFKTALCVLICMVLTSVFSGISLLLPESSFKQLYNLLFLRDTALYSCIAAVVCLQTTVSLTRKTGIIRVVGTLFGGVFSVIVLYIISFTKSEIVSLLLIFSGVMVIISFCTFINHSQYASVAVLMFLIVVFSSGETSAHVAAIHRIIDTFGGAVVAFTVNRFVFSPGDREADSSQ